MFAKNPLLSPNIISNILFITCSPLALRLTIIIPVHCVTWLYAWYMVCKGLVLNLAYNFNFTQYDLWDQECIIIAAWYMVYEGLLK